MKRADIIALFHKQVSKSYDSGCECIFLKLNKDIGLKLYSSKKERNHAFVLQRKAATIGLAPPVYARLSIPGFMIVTNECDYADLMPVNTGKIYGYTTAIARKVGPNYSEQKLEDLSRELDANGFYMCDMHDENVGYYNKRLVAIDFGPVSML